MKLIASGVANCGGDRQVALVLAVGVVDDDHELARGGCPRSRPRSRRRRWSRLGAVGPSARNRIPVDEFLDVLGEHVDLEIDLVAGLDGPERGHFERVRDERDRERVVVERGDRERDAVDRDRALLDAVAEDLRARRPSTPDSSVARPSAIRPTPSTCPWTKWPPSGSPARVAVSRLTSSLGREPAEGRAARASPATAVTEKRPFETAVAVRQAPLIETESPTPSCEAVSGASISSRRPAGSCRMEATRPTLADDSREHRRTG